MARKKQSPQNDERRAAADYYKLNLKAVDDLVTADPARRSSWPTGPRRC